MSKLINIAIGSVVFLIIILVLFYSFISMPRKLSFGRKLSYNLELKSLHYKHYIFDSNHFLYSFDFQTEKFDTVFMSDSLIVCDINKNGKKAILRHKDDDRYSFTMISVYDIETNELKPVITLNVPPKSIIKLEFLKRTGLVFAISEKDSFQSFLFDINGRIIDLPNSIFNFDKSNTNYLGINNGIPYVYSLKSDEFTYLPEVKYSKIENMFLLNKDTLIVVNEPINDIAKIRLYSGKEGLIDEYEIKSNYVSVWDKQKRIYSRFNKPKTDPLSLTYSFEDYCYETKNKIWNTDNIQILTISEDSEVAFGVVVNKIFFNFGIGKVNYLLFNKNNSAKKIKYPVLILKSYIINVE